MTKYFFLMASIIIASNNIAMEQVNSSTQSCSQNYPELPNNFNVPNDMKYKASCSVCGNKYENISKSAIFQSHGKCPQKLTYTEPFFKFYIKVKCPTEKCTYNKEHICTFDSIATTISKLTQHIWQEHQLSVTSNKELQKQAIYYWKYAQPHALKEQSKVQDEECALLLYKLQEQEKNDPEENLQNKRKIFREIIDQLYKKKRR